MLGAETRLLPRAAELARLHAEELPQKDELCGAFARCSRFASQASAAADGGPFDQDTVGHAAGSVLGPEGYDDDLPPGEHGRKDYRLEHPRAAARDRRHVRRAGSCAPSPSCRRAAASRSA